MDIITGAIICAGGLTVIGALDVFIQRNPFSKIKRIWIKLGLDEYRIISKNKEKGYYELIVKIPIGKSIDDIKKYKGSIEKAYKCTCEIEDISCSNNVRVKIIDSN